MHGLKAIRLAGEVFPVRLTMAGYIHLENNTEGGVAGLWDRIIAETFYLGEMRLLLRVLMLGGGNCPSKVENALTRLWGLKVALSMGNAALDTMLASFGKGDGNKSKGDGDISEIYQTAFAIGLKPSDLSDMTIWEFGQCLEGWNLVNGGEAAIDAPDQAEMAELMKRYG